MTIRKKWILTLGIIAILSIFINSFVLSFLTSRYFNDYLDDSHAETCKDIVDFLVNDLNKKDFSQERLGVELDAFLGRSILRIRVFNGEGELIADVIDDAQLDNEHGMGMMHPKNNRNNIVDSYELSTNQEKLGEVHITRFSTAGNSYAAAMFQSSLFRNSLFSIGIVMIVVFLLGLFMSKKVSKDLVQTAKMAQNIENGIDNTRADSNTKEIHMIQTSLESLETKLKLKNKARKTLVDEMVHQTRTPLTILKMHLEGMEDGVIQMDAEEVKVCEGQVDNLTDIIKNMSDLIDVETSDRKVMVENVDIALFLKQILNGMKSQFHRKGIELEIVSQSKINIQTDPYRLGQTIYNILTNAYKFTPSGGHVFIQYQLTETNLEITIEDDGAGISEEEQSRIFDAYFKGSGEVNNKGDGLGLFIAKQNMESINGQIHVISKEGKGSKFVLDIPITNKLYGALLG
jgi:two-component system, OmpR family, sensor histidine kinase BaeS